MTQTPNLTVIELWTFRDLTWAGMDLAGFKVEALDGEIGSVDEATTETGGSFIVVDTGPWIFSKKKVMLPAGVIDRVDTQDRRVFVNRTKDEIKNAPEFDETRYRDSRYHSKLSNYYGEGGTGYRPYAP